ncbi:MAG: cytochrome d ubiquinol oxidase subunit II [Deltaproteobacteria bacterium]|nr:cytochrome d ubiquinol oxidase subunit II [Deltaproteobacteria bacterium]
MSALQVVWFGLVGVLLVGYAILDGFDLGVGFWHLFTKRDEDRRVLLNAIGPVWDGNEVWLLTGGGALFAAFPHVYATVFSGFYLALMLVLFALIFRAVSVEFRNGGASDAWRLTWDWAFGLGSTLPALLFGVALGNILRGLPLDQDMHFTGDFFTLLNPYALMIGLLGFLMIATHGALYLVIKTEGDLQARARGWAEKAWLGYVALMVVAHLVTLVTQPHLVANYLSLPFLFVIPAAALATVVMSRISLRKDRPFAAFIYSSVTIALLFATCGAGLFPNMVPALGDPALSLTIVNASSSELTLTVMLVMALLGMPLVLGYTWWVYRTFAGKATADSHGY